MEFYECLSLLLLVLGGALVRWVYKHQAKVVGSVRAFLSPITYFTLLWWVAYPLHAFLLQWGLVDTQQKTRFFESDLLLSVLLSSALLWAIILGAERYRFSWGKEFRQKNYPGYYIRASVVIMLTIGAALWFLFQTVFQGWEWHPFVGNTQNMMRVGAGAFFLLSTLFIYALLAAIPLIVTPWWKEIGWPGWLLAALFLCGFVLAAIMMVALSSRRMVFVLCFATFIAVMMRWRKAPLMLAVVVVASTVLAAPVMQMVRYIGNPGIHAPNPGIHAPNPGIHASSVKYLGVCDREEAVSPQKAVRIYNANWEKRARGKLAAWISENECRVENYYFYFGLQQIASTYGLADHLATYLHKASWSNYLLGKDHGKAWLFNIGLAYVPRAIWKEKPIQYGSVEIQKWLYPDMFEKEAVTMTLPPGFIVDFLYGLGIIPALVICYFLGRGLGYIRSMLWTQGYGNGAAYAFSLCVMAYMFNIVRGGTGSLMSIYPILAVILLIYGVKPFVRSSIYSDSQGKDV